MTGPSVEHPSLPPRDWSAATRAWFAEAFPAPTVAQAQAWEQIGSGHDTVVVAPTGSGKTLAAFLTAIDRCIAHPPASPADRCRILYVSPLKALAADIERNLRSPLVGIKNAGERLGIMMPDITVGVRTGDTDARTRRRLASHPPDILITTPESLFLMLTSAARESLQGVRTIIVDEIHALAGTKRGAHLAVSLERLEDMTARRQHDSDHRGRIQRIGLSATARPVESIADFLRPGGDVRVVAPESAKEWDLRVHVPVPDMTDLTGDDGPVFHGSAAAGPSVGSIWPHVESRLVDEISRHRSTLIFVNSRRGAERLTASLNERWQGEHESSDVIARAHHGSVSREQRELIEEDLKSGRLPAVVATSSMELGIDMGAIDLVVQIESPPSVASGLQRVGRAGHQVGAVSHGLVFPKYRGDLVQATVTVQRMREGAIEALHIPDNPLDVLAQQVIAIVAMDDWQVESLYALIRRCAPFRNLSEPVWRAVLDMLAGRYPGEEFAEFRPRLVWDRQTDGLSARPGAQRLAVTSGGTIPDRGLFGVFLIGTAMRVGELDEEMVYESRVGDLFALGASSWRIEDITADRVWVSPAPGEVARMPFWRGDRLGRPMELGAAVGRFLRSLNPSTDRATLLDLGLDDYAVDNLMRYVTDQRNATGALPDDRTVVVERFRDELGDWRVVVHTPFGAQVHAPWALALTARLRAEHDVETQVMYSDDGIVLRLPDTIDDATPRAIADLIAFDPDEIEAIVTAELGGSALFAGRFRECAARALLLPRRNPGRRSPLWQQRQRSAQLLSVASRYPEFPIVLETMRECLRDVFDLMGLRTLLSDLKSHSMSIVDVETSVPSPFAQSLLFDYVAQYLYDGDTPLAERRAAALTVDTGMLNELLGQTELRELLDFDALSETIHRVSRRSQLVRDHEDLADLLRVLGPLSPEQMNERGIDPAFALTLVEQRRAIEVRIAGTTHWATIEDAGLLRDGLGCALPLGIPDVFCEPVDDPIGDLLSRFARTHGPFTIDDAAGAFGLGVRVVERALADLAARGRLAHGGFTPGRRDDEWCDIEVLRRARRASIAALRQQAEPVDEHAFARYLADWQGLIHPARSLDGVHAAIEQLAGYALPARHLDALVLPARVAGYSPALLDQLISSGEVIWWGISAVPGDAWIGMAPSDLAPPLLPTPEPVAPGSLEHRVLETLAESGAVFFRDLYDQVARSSSVTDSDLVDALWQLVWSGHITHDSLHPIRARLHNPGRRSRVTPATALSVTTRRPPRMPRRSRAPRGPTKSGPAHMSGRWTALPPAIADRTMRSLAATESMLDRYGILARAVVSAEAPLGGFAATYQVLTRLEESGSIQRTFAVEGLGGAQFALPGVTDRLRRAAEGAPGAGLVLAAADPANPYGASVPWPARVDEGRPTRGAGAVVVLVDSAPVIWLDRGFASLLTWPAAPEQIAIAIDSLVDAAPRFDTRIAVQRIDGRSVRELPHDQGIIALLHDRGFSITPKAITLRTPPRPQSPAPVHARG